MDLDMDLYGASYSPSVVGASASSLSLAQSPVRLAGAPAPNASSKSSGPFFRDAQICPDGSCVLGAADDRSLSLFSLPSQSGPFPSWAPSWTYQPPDSLLSYAWYPGASSADPAMFAFTVGVKDHPVQLLDGTDQRVRASYPIVDHRERFVAPHSMIFSPDGSSLYCGFDNAIEIFDLSAPGAEGYRLQTTPTRGSRQGQKGIISTLAFSPSHGTSLLAAGSFSGSIGLYDPNSDSSLVGLLGSSQKGGLTKVLFHPTVPHLLFCASRQSNHLEVYDLRNFSSEAGRIRRKGRTNQRLGFDVDPTGTWLAAGDQDGNLSIFDAQLAAMGDSEQTVEPISTFAISKEPVGAALFRPAFPHIPQLVTCSGTRHFAHAPKRRAVHGGGGTLNSDSEDTEEEDEQREQEQEHEAREEEQTPSLELWQWN
ncbi:hypothetical protein JCM1841_000770 [Sporobolomyces salmonicolor]